LHPAGGGRKGKGLGGGGPEGPVKRITGGDVAGITSKS